MDTGVIGGVWDMHISFRLLSLLRMPVRLLLVRLASVSVSSSVSRDVQCCSVQLAAVH